MRIFYKALGKVLMSLAGIGLFVTLINSFPMARGMEMSLLGNLVIILCMLLMYLGLFCLGYLIYRAGRKAPESKKNVSVGQPVTSAQSQPPSLPVIKTEPPVRSSQPQIVDEKEELPNALPLPETFYMVLYRNDSAREEASLLDGKSVPQQLQLVVREAKPLLLMNSVQLGELFSGSMYREEQTEREIPKALRAKLDFDSLSAWVEKTVPLLRGRNWHAFADRNTVNRFCQLIRRLAALPEPRWVYYTGAPFPELEDLGPDGLKDESGIAFWLRQREGAEPEQSLSEAQAIAKGGKTVLLTEKPELFAKVCKEKQSSLAGAGVMVCILRENDLLQDLVSRRQYRFFGEVWAESADDAATYGRWRLKEEKPH